MTSKDAPSTKISPKASMKGSDAGPSFINPLDSTSRTRARSSSLRRQTPIGLIPHVKERSLRASYPPVGLIAPLSFTPNTMERLVLFSQDLTESLFASEDGGWATRSNDLSRSFKVRADLVSSSPMLASLSITADQASDDFC